MDICAGSKWLDRAEAGGGRGPRSMCGDLSQLGADASAAQPGGMTALMLAAAANPYAVTPDLWTALMLAAHYGHADAVRALIHGRAWAMQPAPSRNRWMFRTRMRHPPMGRWTMCLAVA